MPAVNPQYIPPNHDDAKLIDELADNERRDRKKAIDHYWKYYDGNHEKPLKVKPGESDDNIIVNLTSQMIDKGVAFCSKKLPAITLPGETPQKGDESTPQQKLDEFWRRNDLGQFLTDVLLDGFISGHSFVKLLEDETGDGYPEVSLLDGRMVTVFWDAMRAKRPLWYRLQWEMSDTNKRRQDIVPVSLMTDEPIYDPESHWVIIEYQYKDAKWREVGQDAWAYPFPPIIDWKNAPRPHSYYGQSDMKHSDINDATNFILSNTGKIIKLHAHPTTITDADADKLKATAVGKVWSVPAGSNVWNLEMQSDLASSLALYRELRSAFFTQARIVDWAAQADKVGQLTNFGLRVLFSDMLDKTETKQELYGKGLSIISQYALAMMGETSEKPITTWEDPLPTNRVELVSSVAQEQQLGTTSNRTLATDLGRDYDVEQEQRAQEQFEFSVMNEGLPTGVSQ